MTGIDSNGAAKELVSFVNRQLQDSTFFSQLRSGMPTLDELRAVFGQYYLWRNQFHRWFGVCIARSAAFGTAVDTGFIISELIEHIEQEIREDHHGMCVAFLAGLGITDAAAISAWPSTQRYNDSFLVEYMRPGRRGEEALAALAGREIVAPARNRIITTALKTYYQVATGLEFFNLHEELEVEHFKSLWCALVQGYGADPDDLLGAAREEIRAHVGFWDTIYQDTRSRSRSVAAG